MRIEHLKCGKKDSTAGLSRIISLPTHPIYSVKIKETGALNAQMWVKSHRMGQELPTHPQNKMRSITCAVRITWT